MTQKSVLTSPGLLKAENVRGITGESPFGDILRSFVTDKGYSEDSIYALSKTGFFGKAVSTLLLRSSGELALEQAGVINYFGQRIRGTKRRNGRIPSYTGLPEQNVAIDLLQTNLNTPSAFIGEGATSRVELPFGLVSGSRIESTPICIVGMGAAGIMVGRALHELGFDNVTSYEKRGSLGIWAQPNVANGSRNNPRVLNFSDLESLSPAPGNGHEVVRFLRDLDYPTDHIRLDDKVTEIIPSNLDHCVSPHNSDSNHYPIVINAIGVGDPVPFNDPERMRGPTKRVAATRWQERLDPYYIAGKCFIFIGLGNSTAEMIRQLHEFQDQGIKVDYRIVTHYPREAVFNPTETMIRGRKRFRVFRDLSRPVLTSYQGDLPQSRYDYYRALYSDRIITDVRAWNVDDEGENITLKSPTGSTRLKYDKLYVLTGYRNPPETHDAMGCTYDIAGRFAHHDYDGEMIKTLGIKGGDRVHQGYFGFGAILEAPHNPNSSVLPGMAHRLPDLLFGIIMRAAQYEQYNV